MAHDYTSEAKALFGRFAERHRLTYEVDPHTHEKGVEVLWTFPRQRKLSLPLTLGLQNLDELNFGVGDFWSYFFPYLKSVDGFERMLDAWVAGDARVAILRGRGRLLQVREGNEWMTVYGANGCLFPFSRQPRGYLLNERAGEE